ncbi:hypothetical protein [Ktedonospora formicarum]|uniref:Zinc-ribbon domain-containing protein n=1 Tax=Ktedonospora formicarum TaxID=2778364 RepID=A0A8J3IF06_9CHLR|nr:hypothetical protein [Ktedonospora formicarum]GHO50019.1 hypothetical protein KSX_81820 [Ktedonospora formicarum]
MKTCPHCGKANDPQAIYCELCGKVLQSSEAANRYTVAQSHGQSLYQEMTPPAAGFNTPIYSETPIVEGRDPYSNPYNLERPYEQGFSSNIPYTPAPLYYAQPTISQGRSVGGIIFGIIFYLIGLTSASIGAGGFTQAFGSNDSILTIAFLLVGLVGLVALVVVTILHKKPFLKWWMRLLIVIGLIIVGFVVLIIAAVASDFTHNPDRTLDLYLGGIMFVFGALIAVFAVL